jgi:hypothetical protein
MTQYYTTAIPIHNVELSPSTSFEFSGGLRLEAMPEWVVGQQMLDGLSRHDREAINEAIHALVMTYPAEALGSPDPDWKGQRPKSIQETKYETGLMANFALWLAKGSPACFSLVLHARHYGDERSLQRIERCSELLCHPSDVETRISDADVPRAIALHTALLQVQVVRDTSAWTAFRAAWAGLQMNIESVRCLLFWVALEALFGPEDGREITFRLAQRVGFFLGATREEARQLFETAKAGYGFRSKIVHGHWKQDPMATQRMAEAENLFRRAYTRILETPGFVETFSTKKREAFLDGLAFNDGTT